MKTYATKASEITRSWRVVDADGATLGRLATEVAMLLRGKHKTTFTPHLDTGDPVIIVNAAKIRVTGNKLLAKRYVRHSGYPGGLRSETLEALLARRPEEVIRRAVRGMLPRNRLGEQMSRKLHVYAGPEHPHAAQKPEPHRSAKESASAAKESAS
jgi:large subunit ribosomal protein L13